MSSVDVIVPCYRYGHFLRECVESVLAQSVKNVRVLIIDDASPDNTAEVAADLVKKDPRVNFLRHAVNKGHIATYNEGIEWVSADYMLLLSADDYLLPGALNRSANLMDAHPEVGFTFGRAITLDDRGTKRQTQTVTDKADQRILTGMEFIELSGSRNIVPTPTAVVRTELQKRLGGYLPELPHSGDMELWLRFAAHASVGMSEAYEAVYRRHAGNMSLDYTVKTWLPDLQQRKAAFDCFFKTCSHALAGRSNSFIAGCSGCLAAMRSVSPALHLTSGKWKFPSSSPIMRSNFARKLRDRCRGRNFPSNGVWVTEHGVFCSDCRRDPASDRELK